MLSFYTGTWKRTRLVFNNTVLIRCLSFIFQEQNILSLKFQLGVEILAQEPDIYPAM